VKVTRRELIKAGSALALFPWLARAQAVAPKRKLVLVFTPHGTIWPQWRPAGTETAFTLSPILAPLAAHQSRLSIIDGVSLPYGTAYYIPHTYTMPALWTGSPIDTSSTLFTRTDHMQSFGWGTGVSIDQAIAARLPANESLFRTIELGTYCGGLHPATRMIYSAPGVVKNPLDQPVAAFNTLFSMPDPNQQAAAATLLRRKSVLDVAYADLQSRKATLTVADRARLDAHGTAIRELERRLELAVPPACTRPAMPAGVDPQTAMDRQSDLLAAALGCGLTRIASLQMRIADNDNSLYPWAGLNMGGHHTLTHDSTSAATLAQVYTWYSGRIAYLLDRLQATPDPSGTGTVLDHTLVVWGSELGVGWTHDVSNVPFIFAGGPGVLQGGRYKVVTNKTNHRVLVTALQHMGQPDMTYGSLDAGSGPLAGVLA